MRCPHCGKTMFVRTRFEDRVRVVATQAEADVIDEKWKLGGGAREFRQWDKDEFEKERAMLRKRFYGQEPSDSDVKWSIFNKDLIGFAMRGQWGMYRSVLLEMGELLRGKLKLKDALGFYFDVCYLDWNVPNNKPIWHGPDPYHSAARIDVDFIPFSPIPERQFFAPYVIDSINVVCTNLNLNAERAEGIFMRRAEQIERTLKTPVSPRECWRELLKKLPFL